MSIVFILHIDIYHIDYINYINYTYYIINMKTDNNRKNISRKSVVCCIVILAQRLALYLCGWLTLVRDLMMDVTIESENS